MATSCFSDDRFPTANAGLSALDDRSGSARRLVDALTADLTHPCAFSILPQGGLGRSRVAGREVGASLRTESEIIRRFDQHMLLAERTTTTWRARP